MENEVTITKNLTKSGDSVILIIPKDIVDALQLNSGTLVEIKLKKLK